MVIQSHFEFNKHRSLIIAFISSNLFIFLSSFESFYNFPIILKYLLSFVTIYYIFLFYKNSPSPFYDSALVKFLKTFFIIVSIYLLITSLRFELFYIQEVFAERFFFMPFLLPIIFLNIRYNGWFYKKILSLTYFFLPFALITLAFLLNFPKYLNYPLNVFIVHTFTYANSLLLYVSHLYNNKKIAILLLLYYILFIIILANAGRRGETIEQLLPLFFFILIRIKSYNYSKTKKVLLLATSILFFTIASIFIYQNSSKIFLFQRGFNKEGFDVSRGETIANFFSDFGTKPLDYLKGRGLNGEVRKFSFGKIERQYSRSIEIGYLNILLKGGLIYLIPMMWLFVVASFKGYFKTNNDLTKGLSLIIVLQLISMVSFGMANYSVYYMLLWIAVASCLDPYMRSLSNVEIMQFLNHK